MTSSPTLQAVVLAAGLGTRMRSETIKVLHDLLGQPLIGHVVDAAVGAGCSRVVSVVGHQREDVQAWLNDRDFDADLRFAVQHQQQGTADAVWAAREYFDDTADYTAILCGDVPNVDGPTLEAFVNDAIDAGAPVALITAILDDPARYGRIVRGSQGEVEAIVEYADATAEIRAIDEINAGIYLVKTSFLADGLARIMAGGADNAQNEYYLTDLIALAAGAGGVFGWTIDDPRKIQGVNSRSDLAQATAYTREKINRAWMDQGVTFLDPRNTTVEAGVTLDQDVTLYPGVHLLGTTRVGSGSVIEPGCMVRDTTIGEGVHLKAHCYLHEARVDDDSAIGPFAHLRPGADIGQNCKVGNFVEIKKTRLDDTAKASHLTYLGDAHIGRGANVGAGTITCNYDGQKKSRTTIGPGAFIGSNTALVAPVTIGDGAYVGAGSVITDDIPDRALGVARGRQRTIEGWADKKS